MKLYGSPTSPYVRKARVLIKEKNLPCEFVVEDPWIENSPIMAKNPLLKIPVLEIGPSNYLFESALVVHYLDHVDGRSLTPTESAGYWQAQWWQALGNGMIDATIARVMEGRRPAEKQWDEKTAREEGRIHRAAKLANDAMQDTMFLVGNTFTLADLVLGVAMQYIDFRYPHDWRSECPKLAEWHGRVVSRSSFQEPLPPGFVQPV